MKYRITLILIVWFFMNLTLFSVDDGLFLKLAQLEISLNQLATPKIIKQAEFIREEEEKKKQQLEEKPKTDHYVRDFDRVKPHYRQVIGGKKEVVSPFLSKLEEENKARKLEEERLKKERDSKIKAIREKKNLMTEQEIKKRNETYSIKYKNLFDKIPEKYKSVVLDYYEEKYLDDFESNLLNDNDKNKYFPLDVREAIIKKNGGYVTSNLFGYTFFSSDYMKGERLDLKLEKIYDEESSEDKEKIVKNYKIHLMPKLDDVVYVTSTLINKLANDPEFGALINQFKVKFNLDRVVHEDGVVFPIIVIYLASGKDKAQRALDEIIALFKDREGLDKTPRYNAKVTSLIYVAQGDGDSKKKGYLKEYFEQPDMVYYKSDFTGQEQDYHLKF